MNKLAAIIGLGANDLEIPLVICENAEKAKEYLISLGLALNEGSSNSFNIPNDGAFDYDEDKQDYTPESQKILNALFKDGDYYDGCGECYVVVIREIDFNTPIVGWYLD